MNPADAPVKKPKRKRIKKRNTGENALKRFFPDNFIEMHRTQGVIFQVTDPESAAVVAQTWESAGRRPTNIVKLKRSVLQWQVLPEPLHEALKGSNPEEFTAVGCCAVDAVLNRIDPACAFVVVRTKDSARGQWSIVAIYAPPPALVIIDTATLSAEVLRVFLCDMVPKRVQHPSTSVSSVALAPAPLLHVTVEHDTADNSHSEDDESDNNKSPSSLSLPNLLCETSSQISPLAPGVPCGVVMATECAQAEIKLTLDQIEPVSLQSSSSSSCLTQQKRGSPCTMPSSLGSSSFVHDNMSPLNLNESGSSGKFSDVIQQRQHFSRTFSEQPVQSALPSIGCLVNRQVHALGRCESEGNVFKQSGVSTPRSLGCSIQGGQPEFHGLCPSLDHSFQSQDMQRSSADPLFGGAEPPPTPLSLMPPESDVLGYVSIAPDPLLSPCEPLPQLTSPTDRKRPMASPSSTQPDWQQQQQQVPSNFGFDTFTPLDPLMWQAHPDVCCGSLHSSESYHSPDLRPSSELDFSHLHSRSMCNIHPNPLSPSFHSENISSKQVPRTFPQEPVGSPENFASLTVECPKQAQALSHGSALSSPTAVPVLPPDPSHVGLHECYRIMAEKVWSASFGENRTAPWPSFLVFVREGGGPSIDPILQPFFCLPSQPDLVRRSRWVMFVLLFHISAWRDDPRPFLAASEAEEWVKNWAFYGVLNRNSADAIMLNSVCEENSCLFRTSDSSWGFIVMSRKNRTLQQNFWHTLFGHHRPGETVMVTTLGKHGSALDMNILESSEVEKDFFYDPKNPYSDRYGSLREIIETKSSMEGFKYVPIIQSSSSYVVSGYSPDPSSSFFC